MMSEYIGKRLKAKTTLHLPGGAKVDGDEFTFTQRLADHGLSVDLWLATGAAELLPDTPAKVAATAPSVPTAAPVAPQTPAATPPPADDKGVKSGNARP